MSEREKIMRRIREALSVAAPVPGAHPGDAPSAVSEPEAVARIREWLPRVGESFEDQTALFAKNSSELKTDFILLDNPDDLAPRLRDLAAQAGWQSVATHSTPLTDRAVELLECRKMLTFNKADLGSCDAGITACDALIAQTGSILVTSRSAGGRALSILPPHHVVIASRDQLLPDLTAAFALLRQKHGDDYPSMISFITGPSRTGDIERILVLGAHGPKRLTVFCV